MSTGFFGNQKPIRYEGPESRNRPRLPLVRPGPAWCSASAWRTISASPSATGTPSPGRAPIPSAAQTFLRPWYRRRDGGGAAQGGRRLRDVRAPRRAVLHLPRPRHRAGRRDARRDRTATSARSPSIFAQKMENGEGQGSCGAPPTCSPTAASWRAPRPIPIPDVFAYAAAQVKNALDVTHELGGANYVFWGGREGYETLLNTDMKRELAQLGRFLNMAVEHKHKIGFKGTFLIEPKPKEPTKHQYDFDVGTHLRHAQGLRPGERGQDQHRAEPRHPRRPHLRARARSSPRALGIFGSIDVNRGDHLLGWDTDQFAMNVPELTLAALRVPEGRRLHHRRHELRRQDPPPVDRAGRPAARPRRLDGRQRPRAAERRDDDQGRRAQKFVDDRYAGWSKGSARRFSPARRASTIWRSTSTRTRSSRSRNRGGRNIWRTSSTGSPDRQSAATPGLIGPSVR